MNLVHSTLPMKRAARYLVGKQRSALRYRRQERVEKISLRGERFRCRIQSREKARQGLVAQIGIHTVKSASTLQTVQSAKEAEFYAVVKGSPVGLILRSMYQDLGIHMKIEIK